MTTKQRSNARYTLVGPRLAANPVLLDDHAFRKTVNEGRHVMPPLKGNVSDQQMADILAWLKTVR